jgi:hypothetical protein
MTAAVAPEVTASETPSPDMAERETWFSALRRSLFVIRLPIAIVVLVAIVLIIPEQVQEIYRALAQDRPNRPGIQLHWPLALASLVGLSLVLWQVARGLSYEYPKHYGPPKHPVARWVLAWVPRLLVAVPLLCAAAGLWLAMADLIGKGTNPLLAEFAERVDRLRLDFVIAIATSVVVAVLLLIVAALFERRLALRGPDSARRVAFFTNWVVFPIVVAASVAVISYDPIRLSQFFGGIPIFALWIAILVLLVGMLARLSLFAIPVLSIIVVYGLGIEYFRLADNHAIRGQPRDIQRPLLDAAFKQWLANRKDFAAYEAAKRPYPVYVVAAEGGGLYAAYMTARLLSRIQDLCPSFAHHVFAISSVSGGSLGAAVFAGLVADNPKLEQPTECNLDKERFGPMERQASRVLSADFLSPALWAALYPDFLQRFIPRPFPQLDRAVYLERAFEQAWPKTASNRNPMTDSFFDLCGPAMAKCLNGATPLLAFNVTNVETGLQIVLSPIDLTDFRADASKPSPSHKVFDFFGLVGLDPFDLPMSTAVGLSARFPYISPPGWYAWEDEATKVISRFTFVDGGYVDNSGVATALNIAQRLDALNPRPNVEIKVLMVSALWAPIERVWIEANSARPRLERGELTPPLEAAFNARQGRGYKTQFDAALEAKPGLSVTELGFYYDYVRPPLGWQLADVSRRYIRLFRGDPDKCPTTDEKVYRAHISRSQASNEEAAASYIRRADCVVAQIKNDLTPSEPPFPSWQPINPAR